MDRRNFTKTAGLGLLAINLLPKVAPASMLENNLQVSKVPLGVGNHSLRAIKPNAKQLIEYAIKHKLDSVQFNTLQPFESLENSHLLKLKDLAKSNDISIYIGLGSICEQSVQFSNRFGNVTSLLNEGIRVAKTLESKTIGVRIGGIEDRYTDGGIKPKIEAVVKLMKSRGASVSDAGIKFAFENHAGDMRSEELLDLINETGSDICGAFYDPGNAIYGMEDPMIALKLLSKHIVNIQARDVVVWGIEDGAAFQWTAIGEGLMDFKYFTKYVSENCPGVPIHLETISNSTRSIPYLKPEYWDGFPGLNATGIIDFLKLVKQGQPMQMLKPASGENKKEFDNRLQQLELSKSIDYLRNNCNAGLKPI